MLKLTEFVRESELYTAMLPKLRDADRVTRFDNMFVARNIPLEHSPDSGKTRKITLRFASPMKEAQKVMKRCGGQRVTWNGHYERNFVRKAQFHYVSEHQTNCSQGNKY